MNKKGQVEDVFDFMFTAFVLAFMFIFLGLLLSQGAKTADDNALKRLSVAVNIDQLIHVNSFALHQGQDIDFGKMQDRERSIREFIPGFEEEAIKYEGQKAVRQFGAN